MPPDEVPEIRIADVKAYEAWLRSLAWRILRNAEDVDDVMQDVWLASLGRKDARFSPSWLHAVARNRSLTRRRRRMARLDVEKKAARSEELGENVQSALERVSLYKQVLQWIVELEDPYRETLLLHYARDMKLRDVARLMDVPDSTVRVRLKRGLAILRKKARETYDERRRHRLLFILFGAEGAKPFVLGMKGLACAALTLALALTIVLAEPWSSETSDRAQLPPDGAGAIGFEAASRPSRHTGAVLDTPPGGGARGPLEPAHEIRGRLEFHLGSELHGGRLEIEAVPFMVGRAMALPALRPRPPDFADGYEAVAATSVANGAAFRIAVPKPGRYRLMVSIDGVEGALQYWTSTDHWTNAAQPPLSRFELLDGLTIHHRPREHGRYEIVWRHRSGARHREVVFDSNVAVIDGVFMPRLLFRWTDARNGQVWRREINDPVTSLRLPDVERTGPFTILRADTGRAARDVRLSLFLFPRDNMPWISSVTVPDALHAEIFLPECTSARGLVLDVEARESMPRYLDLSRGKIPASIELDRRETVRARVVGEEPRRLDHATVVATDGGRPCLAGESSPDGRVEFTPIEYAAPGNPTGGRRLTLWVLGEKGLYGCSHAAIEDGAALVELPYGKTFRVRVRDADSEPVGGAKIIVLPWEGAPIGKLMGGERLTTDGRGEAEFGAVCGGKWFLDVHAEGFKPRGVVVDWAADTEDALIVELEESKTTRRSIVVLGPDGEPLPYASVYLGASSGSPAREVQADREGRARLGVLGGESVRLEVSYPGFAPSLSSPRRTSTSEPLTTVTMSRIVDVPFTVYSPIEGPVRVRCTAGAPASGRERSFRIDCGEMLSLTDEDQVVEVIQRGCAPQVVEVGDRGKPITVSLQRGPRFSVLDCEIGDEISLDPMGPWVDPPRAGALRSYLALEKTSSGDTVEWTSITPGSYRVELRRRAQGIVQSLAFEITGDRSVSCREFF